MKKYIDFDKDLEEIDFSIRNQIWKKYLDNYAKNNECILKNKVALIFFFENIHLSLENYDNFELECIVN